MTDKDRKAIKAYMDRYVNADLLKEYRERKDDIRSNCYC